jgi:hypothetical protein
MYYHYSDYYYHCQLKGVGPYSLQLAEWWLGGIPCKPPLTYIRHPNVHPNVHQACAALVHSCTAETVFSPSHLTPPILSHLSCVFLSWAGCIALPRTWGGPSFHLETTHVSVALWALMSGIVSASLRRATSQYVYMRVKTLTLTIYGSKLIDVLIYWL